MHCCGKARNAADSKLKSDTPVCVAAQTLTDNLLLYSYQQWESKEDFYEHIKSKAVEPLAEYIKDKVTLMFRSSNHPGTSTSAAVRCTYGVPPPCHAPYHP